MLFFSSRRRHTRCALVTGVQTCALPIWLFKRLGDPVRAGETIAIVQSRDAAQIAAERVAADARSTLAQKNLHREKTLLDQKVSARVDYERAQAEAAAAEIGRASCRERVCQYV